MMNATKKASKQFNPTRLVEFTMQELSVLQRALVSHIGVTNDNGDRHTCNRLVDRVEKALIDSY